MDWLDASAKVVSSGEGNSASDFQWGMLESRDYFFA